MSDHSDLVARARAHAAEREAEGKGAAMLWELADALEAADSRARVLPTREQIVTRLQRTCQSYQQLIYEPIPFGLMADDILALLTGGNADE